MSTQAALAAAATLIATAFALSTLDRWLADRRPHQGAWTLSLFAFALASGALWWGAGVGWGPWSFRLFYLFGAVINVPLLAVGTVYLLADRRFADRTAAVVGLLLAFAAGVIVAAPLLGPVPASELPRGSDVFGPGPRIAAAVASGLASVVLIGGAVWSIVRLGRGRRTARPVGAGRLAAANGLIAAGTLVLAAGGLLNSVVGDMNAFSLSLVVGIAVLFGGFLLTNTARPVPSADPEWLRDLLGEDEGPPDNVTRIA